MSGAQLFGLAPAKLALALKRWALRRAIRQSRRDCDVLNEHISVYQQELAAEHRRQVRLINDLNKL
jgi:hypothetical protein